MEADLAEFVTNRSIGPPGNRGATMASLEEELGRLGARVSPQWLASCLAFLQGSQPGLAAAPAPARAKAVLQQLLATDLNQCGAPALPPGVQVGLARPDRWFDRNLITSVAFRAIAAAHCPAAGRRRQPQPAADFWRCPSLPPGPARHHAAGQAAAASG